MNIGRNLDATTDQIIRTWTAVRSVYDRHHHVCDFIGRALGHLAVYLVAAALVDSLATPYARILSAALLALGALTLATDTARYIGPGCYRGVVITLWLTGALLAQLAIVFALVASPPLVYVDGHATAASLIGRIALWAGAPAADYYCVRRALQARRLPRSPQHQPERARVVALTTPLPPHWNNS